MKLITWQMVFIYRNKKLYDIDEILYGANRKLYTMQMYIKQYVNVGKVKYCKKKKTQQNGIHDKHVINYGKSDLL